MAKVSSCLLLGSLCVTSIGCGDGAEPVGSSSAPLVAVCAETMDQVPQGAWLCGTPRSVECSGHPGVANPKQIYVVPNDGCQSSLVVERGPFAVGEHEIVVSRPATSDSAAVELCRSQLLVVDSTPPVAKPLKMQLWPPNH